MLRRERPVWVFLWALVWLSTQACTLFPQAADTVTHDGLRAVDFGGLTPTSPTSPTAPRIQVFLTGDRWQTLGSTTVLPTEPITVGLLNLYPYIGSSEIPDIFWRRSFNRYQTTMRVIEEGGTLGHFVGGAGQPRNEAVISAPEMFVSLQNKLSGLPLDVWGVSDNSFTISGSALADASCNECRNEPGASGVLCQDPPSCDGGSLKCPCSAEEFVEFASEPEGTLERYLELRPELDPAVNPDSGSAVIVLDIEHPSEINPKNWHLLSASDPVLFGQVVEAFKDRIIATRKVYPNAKLGLYMTFFCPLQTLGGPQMAWENRKQGWLAGVKAGIFDRFLFDSEGRSYPGLDVLVPVLYVRFGDLDNSWMERNRHCYEEG